MEDSSGPLYDAPPPLPASGERYAELRRREGVTQREFARRLGLSVWQLDRLEAGEITVERLPTATQQALRDVWGERVADRPGTVDVGRALDEAALDRPAREPVAVPPLPRPAAPAPPRRVAPPPPPRVA